MKSNGFLITLFLIVYSTVVGWYIWTITPPKDRPAIHCVKEK